MITKKRMAANTVHKQQTKGHKKMKKRFFIIISVAVLLVLTFSSCGKKEKWSLDESVKVDPLTHARPSVYFITEDSYELYRGEPVENPERYFKDIYMNAPDLAELAK